MNICVSLKTYLPTILHTHSFHSMMFFLSFFSFFGSEAAKFCPIGLYKFLLSSLNDRNLGFFVEVAASITENRHYNEIHKKRTKEEERKKRNEKKCEFTNQQNTMASLVFSLSSKQLVISSLQFFFSIYLLSLPVKRRGHSSNSKKQLLQ